MAKWQDRVEINRSKESNDYQSGKKLLVELFNKYNFDLSNVRKEKVKDFNKTDKRNLFRGLELIGYNEKTITVWTGICKFELQ